MKLNTISKIIPEPDCKLRLVYSDGKAFIYDFNPLIQIGGLFKQLRNTAYFKKVIIGGQGRYIEFPGDLDFCADSLRIEGVEVAS
ncbi:MAG: DUF2442 domain-containing protein [Candidatus Hatepunaea meridiana]|nr:DUF2442 domain-containing protein [Candidatus Hatepunaea meridiana]